MEERGKEILFYGMKPSKAVVRVIERQLEKWTARKIPSRSLRDEAAYRVSFEPESGGCLCCSVQVQVGSENWVGQDVGKSAQDALFNALQHLSKSLINYSSQSPMASRYA